MNKLIMKEDEDILSFFRTLDHMVERLDGLSRNYRPMLNGERFLSDREPVSYTHLTLPTT